MKVPFVDLRAQYTSLKEEVDRAVLQILAEASFIGGEVVVAFERDFSAYSGARHAIGVANGTDALQLALRAIGIGLGDEVITVPHTFIATAAAISTTGAKPVFVDIDPSTYTIDVSQIEEAITERTKAIIPVHIYGHPADMKPILEIARKKSLYVVEDAAQAHGATYDGQRIGSIGHIACFSFYPGKNLGAYGDGGAVTTNDSQIAEAILRLRDHGRVGKYDHATIGFNSRLDAIQAAVLSIKLRHLDRWNRQRQTIAAWYETELNHKEIRTPVRREKATHVYHLYVIETDNREALQAKLSAKGIVSGVHYPTPLHLQPAFTQLGYRKGDFPHSEKASNRVLSLPMFPEMTYDQVKWVSDALNPIEACTSSV